MYVKIKDINDYDDDDDDHDKMRIYKSFRLSFKNITTKQKKKPDIVRSSMFTYKIYYLP